MDVPPMTAIETPPAGRRSKEHWVVLAFGILALFALAGASLFLEPDARGFGTHEKLGLQPCLPMDQWGIPCPGCGVTTSVTLATKGRLWESFKNQPFGLFVACAIAGFGVWAPLAHWRRRDLWDDVRSVRIGRWLVALVAMIGAAWVWKLVVVLVLGSG